MSRGSLSKSVLRERIYCTCLDYFCSPPGTPVQRGAALQDDIAVTVRFWLNMHAEKKYLKGSAAGDQVSNLKINIKQGNFKSCDCKKAHW